MVNSDYMERTFFIVLFVIILNSDIQAQYIQQIKYNNVPRLRYERFEKKGHYLNNVPVGKWQDVSMNGVIYGEYYYDNKGNPTGVWTFTFPDGTIRKQFEFVDNKLIRYKRYHFVGGDFFEVRFNQAIDDSVYLQLQQVEQEIYYNENTDQKIIVAGDDTRKFVFHYDPFLATKVVLAFFSSRAINCDIDLWNTEGKHWRKWSYLNGEIYEIYYDFDKNNNLVSQTEYVNNKKIKKTKFNPDGSIKK